MSNMFENIMISLTQTSRVCRLEMPKYRFVSDGLGIITPSICLGIPRRIGEYYHVCGYGGAKTYYHPKTFYRLDFNTIGGCYYTYLFIRGQTNQSMLNQTDIEVFHKLPKFFVDTYIPNALPFEYLDESYIRQFTRQF